jgi:hypothetical protein
MEIAIVNRSSMVSDADVQTMTTAVDIQLQQHFLPAWRMTNISVKFYPKGQAVPAGDWVLYIIDSDPTVEGALGFHTEEGDGRIDGYVMCQPVLSNGGVSLVFDPSNQMRYTVSSTLSHEVLETAADFLCNTYADCGRTSFAQEVADPVEDISYPIQVNGALVAVSDFVFPEWFDPRAAGVQVSYMRSVSTPFSLTSGGYAVIRTGGPGTEKQVFGKTMPDWRVAQKKSEFSRSFKRTGPPVSLWKQFWRELGLSK